MAKKKTKRKVQDGAPEPVEGSVAVAEREGQQEAAQAAPEGAGEAQASPAPGGICECARVEPAPAGADCTICGGVIPEPAAELQVPPADAAAERKPKGQGLELRVDPEQLKERPSYDPNLMRESTVQMTEAERIAESRQALKQPLAPGMAFFESPEGYIIVAEATNAHVLCRPANGGKGMLINPKR